MKWLLGTSYNNPIQLLAGNPGIWRPHLTRSTLLELPFPLGPSLPTRPRIRALILDKDNTLCPPNTTFIHPAYREAIEALKASPEFSHHPHSILIVSNTAGKTQSAKHEDEAHDLETQLGLPVFRQWQARSGVKKPLVGEFLVQHLRDAGVISSPQEIAVVGDKISTDVLMARSMRSWSVYLDRGWRDPETPTKSHEDWGTWIERQWLEASKDVLWSHFDDASETVILPGQLPKQKSWKEIWDAARVRWKKRSRMKNAVRAIRHMENLSEKLNQTDSEARSLSPVISRDFRRARTELQKFGHVTEETKQSLRRDKEKFYKLIERGRQFRQKQGEKDHDQSWNVRESSARKSRTTGDQKRKRNGPK